MKDLKAYSPEAIKPGCKQRNIIYVEILPSYPLGNAIENVFNYSFRDNPEYKQNLKKICPTCDSVSTRAIVVYLGKADTSVLGSSPQYEILDVCLVKYEETGGKAVVNPITKVETIIPGKKHYLVYSKTARDLKLMLDSNDVSLYAKIKGWCVDQEGKRDLFEPVIPPKKGPFFVRDQREFLLYSSLFSGYTVPLSQVSPLSSPQNVPATLFKFDTLVVLDLSLFGAKLAFRDWSFDLFQLGNEELGYPFWSSGQFSFSISSPALFGSLIWLKAGMMFPLALGKREEINVSGLWVAKSRILNGVEAPTGSISIDLGKAVGFGFPVFLEGSGFSAGDIGKTRESLATDENDAFYYVPTAFRGYFSMFFKDEEAQPTNIIQLKLGIGYHRVMKGQVIHPSESTTRIDNKVEKNALGPYFKLGFVNFNENNNVGLSLQYYYGSFIVGAWIELIRDVLCVEGLYATKLKDYQYPWDNTPLVMISPRFLLNFSRWFE